MTFYSENASITISGRKIIFTTNGGSTTSTTRAQLVKDTADLVMRIETKIKSETAMEQARKTLSLYGRALALAEQNGL